MAEYRRVAVIGPGGVNESKPFLEVATRVGELLAGYERVVTITGGLAGVMGAASMGAAMRGGITLGFLPGDNIDLANRYVNIPVPTGMGEARNVLVIGAAEAVVSIGGSWGTMSELAIARKRRIPVASISGWQVVGAPDDLANVFEDADAAVGWVEGAIGLVRPAPPSSMSP